MSIPLEQPTFHPEPGDVDRLVAREFPSAQNDAIAILDAVASERVKVACLYLARGDLDRLASAAETARIDARDVIAPAEYESYLALPLDASVEARNEAITADAERYAAWISR